MILPDVNVLVYAYRADAEDHALYANWLNEVVRGGGSIGLVESVLLGFLRIVTNSRVVADPPTLPEALGFVDAVRAAPGARTLAATPAVWRDFSAIAAGDRHVRANLVPDAWLAAMAIAHGCRLATADRGFARFDRLDWFDPVDPTR